MVSMRLICVALALAALSAGCIADTGMKAANIASRPASIVCDDGAFVTGITSTGLPECAAPHAGFRCAAGQFVDGFDADGRPHCSALPVATPQNVETQEVASNLKVNGIYGVRGSTMDSGLWDIKINLELSAGAAPMDLHALLVSFATSTGTRNYTYSSAALSDGAPPSPAFHLTWIRGTGANAVMEAGDLVELHFNQNTGTSIPPSADAQVMLMPTVGSVQVDFRTPSTYGSDLIITLR